MKKIFCLISVLVLIFAVAACSKKKKNELPDYEEQVSKEIKAEEGGKVESSDGKTSVDIPAGALDEDTTITMTIYNAEGYEGTEGKKVISKVVNFEPNGTIFKKPVIITMATGEEVKDKTIVAAVYDEKGEKWSYSQGFYVILDGKTEAGDPIMHTTDGKEVTVSDGNLTTAAGDPIMMTNAAGDPIMTNAAGDPIMMSAAGDPIMLASAGDPIMSSAAGDPIMNSAAGDPIMMTTGHFTTYLFAEFDPREKEEEEPDEEPVDDSDTVEPDDDPDTASPDEDVIPEPDPVYSKVVCTGQRTCGDDKGKIIDCPQEGGALYGQDANYAVRGACVPQNFEKLQADPEAELSYPPVKDNNTGLTWLVTGIVAPWIEENPEIVPVSEYCGTVEYDGGGWRLPTPKELLTIADADINTNFFAMRAGYFPSTNRYDGSGEYWSSDETYYYEASTGRIVAVYGTEAYGRDIVCVKGEEFGKTNSFISKTVDGEETIFDETTNLMWQKTSASGKNWKTALSYCEGLEYAGYSDWRLPNKNEFATLVNYSKTGDAAKSDFPGMEKENFILSTLYQGFDDGMLFSNPWFVEMEYGSFDTAWMDEEYEMESTFSVRCVRSDLTAAPAAGVTPECDPKIGVTPCKDSSSNIIWSQRFMFVWDYSWEKAAQSCRNLDQNGGHKWRLPTIDELRTLVEYDPIKKGGACSVSTECFYFDDDCYDECDITTEGDGFAFESKLRDYGILVSGTAAYYEDDYPYSWAVRTDWGAIAPIAFDDSEGTTVVRCVYDENMIDLPTPHETSGIEEGRLYWSSISNEPLYWSDAAIYCHDLEEGGKSDWRVPYEEELYMLVANNGCNIDEPPCKPYSNGYYSAFGDAATLWTSTSYDTEFELFDFMRGESTSTEDEYFMAYARCVRSDSDEPEEEFEFPWYDDGTGNMWSEISPNAVYSIEEAQTYCDTLSKLDGYQDWVVPSRYDLKDIVTSCSGFVDAVMGGDTCEEHSFKGYSVFGDMVPLISSDADGEGYYYAFDFAKGKFDSWLDSYYVRCVASMK